MILAGHPATTTLSGTSLVTDAPPATTEFSSGHDECPNAHPGILFDDHFRIDIDHMPVVEVVADGRNPYARG